ncbi:hypothetical protein C1631_022920 [Chryseobacterium phosphatilyticum]|uniref:Uncharacterized protein n=1 Tax=Chryseobacterium phosphatilyticum TaxID=475075 RepID=A0A316WLY2_9FLAO|nr:hypothetical protein [Chryseobacterium phosphatilyticum]PWN62421.1 hypothetical protein C1631_022920 [Chryseobacterium phosphatilyticum]
MENFNLTAHVVDANRNQSNHLKISGSFESIEQQLKDLATLASSESIEEKRKLHFTIANEAGKQLIGNVYPIELSGNLIDLKRHYKVPIGTDELWAEQKKWERELSKRTELSDGLTNTGIDEKHAHYYRTYFAAHQIELEEKNEFFETIDLFNKQQFLPEELETIVAYWSDTIENAHSTGESDGDIFSYCEDFKKACEEQGYTLEYGLDGQPYFLRPISLEEQLNLERKIINIEEISISETIENKKESLRNDVDNNINFFVKNSFPNEIEILKQYVWAKEEEYDNRISDGTSKFHQNNFKELINSSDKIDLELINNIIEVADKYLNEEPYLNRIYRIDNLKNIIHEHEKIQQEIKIDQQKIQNPKEFFKNLVQSLSGSDLNLLVQYLRTKIEQFDNFFADSSSSKEKKIYDELIINVDKDQVKGLEKIIDDNTFAQSGRENQIQIDELKNLIHEEKKELLLSILPDSLKGFDISEKHKEQLIKNGEITIISPIHDDELLVQFSLTKNLDIKMWLPSGEEDLIKYSDLQNSFKEKELRLENKEFKVGSLATAKVESGIFKGKIIEIEDNKITIENLKGETVTASKNEVYQFFQGQKYDRSEIQSLFSSDPAGIKFSFLEKNDITKLMRGELTNTVFKGYTVKDGKDYFYEFKFRAEYSKIQGKLTLKPYWKNRNEDMPVAAFGTALTKEQIQEASQGKSIIVDGISRESKPFSVKVHYDKDLNAFIADKYVNNAATIKITTESTIKEDSFKEKRGPKI